MAPKKQQKNESITPEPPTKKARNEAKTAVATPPPSDDAPSTTDAAVLKSKASSTSGAQRSEEDILKETVPFVRKTKDADFKPSTTLKLISWNVAGLRALLKKDDNPLQALVDAQKPDVLCLQETKLSDAAEAAKIGSIAGYTFVDSVSVAKKGYSGTRTYVRDGLDARHVPGFNVAAGGVAKADEEGRVLTTFLEGGRLALVNSYVPNSGMTLDRLAYRTETYDPMVRKLLGDLHTCVGKSGAVVWTGDLNVAERDYDRYFATNFKAMQKVPGFTPEERASFRVTLKETQMVDSFRHLYPNAAPAYTFWSARFQSKAKGNGWRLDYFVVSSTLADRVVDSFMLPDVAGSDHCPLVLWLKK